VTLSRDLGLFDVTMIGVGAMIGAGVFVLTGSAAGVAGPALILAFLLNGIVTTMTAFSYAELGSSFFEAGGSYVWVKRGLGMTWGFLSGWLSWFATSLACALYGLGFGRFATELILIAGLPTLGLSVHQMTLLLMSAVILVFTYINYRGASETGTVGNVVTIAKVVILLTFAAFGLLAMSRTTAWHARFTEGLLPNGLGGIFLAMGLTFVAFEGYEIIAQSGEEVVNPSRNIPRAIFIAIAVVVVIYVLVAFVAIGAVQPPEGLRSYQYLGQQKELAIIEAARQFMPYGAVLLLISGLASTMSALNATIYSSSRVSFAMGRDRNLPAIFSQIHPWRHTPYWAIAISGGFVLLMGWSLPLEDVASAADIMFLLLFLLVNVTVIIMRRRQPELDRGFVIRWFPWLPLAGIISNLALALHMFNFSPVAWYVTAGWIVVGLLVYWGYFSKAEEMERPREILLEEVLVSRDYSVLVPVVNEEQGRILGIIGSAMAKDHNGEVLALHVARVPPQLSLSNGRLFMKEGRPPLEAVIRQGKAADVPVHTMIRLGRNVAEAVRKTALEHASDLIILGWPGYTNTSGRIFGSVIDPVVDNPPTDIALVRYRKYRPLRKILVPIAGGPNSRLAAQLAASMARANDQPVTITGLHVVRPGVSQALRIRAQKAVERAFADTDCQPRAMIIEGENVVDTILATAEDYDLIVLGATNESLFENLLLGNIPEQVTKRASVTVIVVKRRSGPVRSFLREMILPPTTSSE